MSMVHVLMVLDIGCSSSLFMKEPDPVPDSDGDGYLDDVDCSPQDASVHPGVLEICNQRDDDCDSLVDELDDDVIDLVTVYLDADGDGYGDVDQAEE